MGVNETLDYRCRIASRSFHTLLMSHTCDDRHFSLSSSRCL
jgi:hypothetical protein